VKIRPLADNNNTAQKLVFLRLIRHPGCYSTTPDRPSGWHFYVIGDSRFQQMSLPKKPANPYITKKSAGKKITRRPIKKLSMIF
jgi:hypothetical protein